MTPSIKQLVSGFLMGLRSRSSIIMAGNVVGMLSITSAIVGAKLAKEGEAASKGTEEIKEAFKMSWQDATPAHELLLGWVVDISRVASLEAVKFGYQNPDLPWNMIADGWSVVMMLSVAYITIRAANTVIQVVKA